MGYHGKGMNFCVIFLRYLNRNRAKCRGARARIRFLNDQCDLELAHSARSYAGTKGIKSARWIAIKKFFLLFFHGT